MVSGFNHTGLVVRDLDTMVGFYCGDLGLKRQRMKRLIADLEREHPEVKQSMITALGHVVPSHLIDRTLQAAAASRQPGAGEPAGDGDAQRSPARLAGHRLG